MYVDPQSVFNSIEEQRHQGALSDSVTSARFVYQTSRTYPDYIERIDRDTGTIIVGLLINGSFVVKRPKAAPQVNR